MFCIVIKTIFFLVVFLKIVDATIIGSWPNCGATSTCVLLTRCQSLLDYIRTSEKPLKLSTVQFLRSQQCGFHEGYPKVCCLSQNLPATKKISEKTDHACKKNSECRHLKDCQPYMDLLKCLPKPPPSLVVDFLRAQQCGFEEGYPKVCCSILPKRLKGLEQSRTDSKPQLNKFPNRLSLEGGDISIKATTEVNEASLINEATTFNAVKSTSSIREKAEAFNKAFAETYFDFTSAYDLFRRKRYSNNNNNSEIKII